VNDLVFDSWVENVDSTAVGLLFGFPKFTGNAVRRIVDIASNGVERSYSHYPKPGVNPADWDGPTVDLARIFAESQAGTINCLTTKSDEPTIAEWYSRLVASADGYVMQITSWKSFERAITRKLLHEILTASGT
jgi:hypothetical protein